MSDISALKSNEAEDDVVAEPQDQTYTESKWFSGHFQDIFSSIDHCRGKPGLIVFTFTLEELMQFANLIILFLLVALPVLGAGTRPQVEYFSRTESLPKLLNLSSVDGTQTPSLIFLPQQQEIELALSAGPEHLRTDATVYVFGKKGYERVRSGKNGFTCMVNRDGNQNGDNDLKPTCWDAEGSATIVPVMLRVGELLAQGKTAKQIELDIAGKFSEGHFTSPRKTGIAYMLRGDVQYDPRTMAIGKTLFPPHYMIYAPGVSNADIGMNMDAYKRNPSLPLVYSGYSGGSRTAYIIVVASESKAHTH